MSEFSYTTEAQDTYTNIGVLQKNAHKKTSYRTIRF